MSKPLQANAAMRLSLGYRKTDAEKESLQAQLDMIKKLYSERLVNISQVRAFY